MDFGDGVVLVRAISDPGVFEDSLLLRELVDEHLLIRNCIEDLVLAEKHVAWLEIVRQPALPHLQRQDVALARDLEQPLVQFFEGRTHQIHEVALVDVVSLLAEQLLVHVPEQLEQERLLHLDRVADRAAHLVEHELEFSTLHVRLVVVAEEIEDHYQKEKR